MVRRFHFHTHVLSPYPLRCRRLSTAARLFLPLPLPLPLPLAFFGQALLTHGSLGTGLACLVLLLAQYPTTAALLAVQLRGHHWASAWFAVPAYDAACLFVLPYLQASACHAAVTHQRSQTHTLCCRMSYHHKPLA